MTLAPLKEGERQLLAHISRWGSDGYPVRRIRGGRWVWDDAFGVKGSPLVYRTKRAAESAFESWLSLAHLRLAEERQRNRSGE